MFCNVWILIDNILSPDATTRNIIKQLMFFKNSKIIHISFSYFQRTVVILNAKVLNVPNFFVDLYLGPNPSRPTLLHETKQKISVGIYPEPTGTSGIGICWDFILFTLEIALKNEKWKRNRMMDSLFK